MVDSVLSGGLEQDRYLKAVQLLNRFETELRRELERIGDTIAAANRRQFVDNVSASWNNNRSAGSIIAFARVDYELDRQLSAANGGDDLTLNLSFRWIDPTQLGHTDVEGALTILSYKIKQLDAETYTTVSQQTQTDEWEDISCADDVFNNAPGIFYIPVETAEDIDAVGEQLQAHFEANVSSYGEPQ